MTIGSHISEPDLAKLYGCLPRYIRDLASKGIIPKKGPNGFPAWEAIGSIIAHLRSSPTNGDKKLDLAAEKLRKTTLEADALQRAKEIDEGDLIPAPIAISLVNEHFAAVRSEFEKDYQLTIPSLCEGKTSGAIRKITDKLFAERCRTLSTRKAKCLPDSAD